MELFQVFWDDQKKLFLEFKKNEGEQLLFIPEKIRRLTLRFEISKQEILHNEPPYLISIKKLYHSSETLSFTIEFDELIRTNDLQIRILKLTIFLFSGQKFEYLFAESFKISDIGINEDCYSGLDFEDLHSEKICKNNFTQEKLFQEIKTNFQKNKEQRTLIYQKNKIKHSLDDKSLLSLISEGNQTLKRIEKALENLSFSISNNSVQYNPTLHISRRSEPAIERIKMPTKKNTIENQISSSKLMVIKEMKLIFKENIEKNSTFNIKDVLKPLTEEELKLMTLSDEELLKKEKQSINNQIKRFKKQQKEKVNLKDLKSPK
ncbi:MAG: hypothetical protein ACFFEY_00900 [Candidatus Thorarchaeota archaeon]